MPLMNLCHCPHGGQAPRSSPPPSRFSRSQRQTGIAPFRSWPDEQASSGQIKLMWPDRNRLHWDLWQSPGGGEWRQLAPEGLPVPPTQPHEGVPFWPLLAEEDIWGRLWSPQHVVFSPRDTPEERLGVEQSELPIVCLHCVEAVRVHTHTRF